MPKVIGGLTQKQKLFIENYLGSWNATEAARQAGYKGNDVTLATIGHENLHDKPYITEEINRRIEQLRDEHGQDALRAIEHFRANGSKISAGMKTGVGFIYFIREQYGSTKIGKTINIKRRLGNINLLVPYSLELIFVIKSDNVHKLEGELHRKYNHLRIKGEWFNLSDSDLDFIKATYGTYT